MIRAIGLAIYTYTTLEDHLDPLWEWLHEVEEWFGIPFSELHYWPRNKRASNILNASQTNRKRLYKRLHDDMPWNLISFGTPGGILGRSIVEYPHGIDVTVFSWPTASHGLESYRYPSRLCILVNPNIFINNQKTEDFINLGAKAWSLAEGAYGFIDIDTGIPPNDNLVRNIACLVGDLVPLEYFKEFREWQTILPALNKKIWKVFWGNYLNQGHLQQLGGYADLRKADWFRDQAEILEESRIIGKKIVDEKLGEMLELSDKGCFFRLSESPLNWEQKAIQLKRRGWQEVLTPISIEHYSL